MHITEKFREKILTHHGASEQEVRELLSYNRNIFDFRQGSSESNCDFPDEPFVETWDNYVLEAKRIGVFQCLYKRLVQFRFPIRQGISQSTDYLAAVRRGAATEVMAEASGLVLNHPESLRLLVHHSLAGRIPVLIAPDRSDFVSIVRALSMKNEPDPVPDSMGAVIIAGYNNWDRIRAHRKVWEDRQPAAPSKEMWQFEFNRLIPNKELYQDRFMLLSSGPYSAVAASEIKIDEQEWLRISLDIRMEHECTHYFTRRLFGSMRNNLFDEIIADYFGIRAAAGNFKAEWFLYFMGLENYPDYHRGARLENYRGDPPLSPGAFKILMTLVKNAALNLQHLDQQIDLTMTHGKHKARILSALCRLTLEVLASEEIGSFFEEAFQESVQGK